MLSLGNEYKTALTGIKFIDLFAGIGAFRLALESFGAKCVFSSEFEPNAQVVYKLNYGEVPYGDITLISETSIPSHDILCAGFPCQPFSISGNQLGFTDTRGTLFFDVARIAKYHQPSVILLENVRNLVSHDGGKTMQVMLSVLDEIGYSVFFKILNAADYGVPQSRNRVYFVCFRKDLGVDNFIFPVVVPLKTHLCDVLVDTDISLYEISIPAMFTKTEPTDFINRPYRIGYVNKGRQGERIYSTKGTAITLSANGGGVGAKTGLYLVDSVIRRLTPLECARVSGFPETFKLALRDNVCYCQFGNTIVVDVLQYIVISILDCCDLVTLRSDV